MNQWLPALTASLRFPKHFVESAWTGHIPALFSLMSLTRPRLFVELGVHNGASFFAACQAVETENLPTKCFAVDHWEGDPHAGIYDNQVFDEFVRTLEAHYSDFASYIRQDFNEAVTHFEDGSIDLLHIDGFHSYSAVKNDFDTWRAKLSDRAIVIFHDINEYGRDFGVWRFWGEIEKEFGSRALSFGNDHGLGVLFLGKGAVEPFGGDKQFEDFAGSWDVVQTLYAGLSEMTRTFSLQRLENERQHAEFLAIASNRNVDNWAEIESVLNRRIMRIAIRIINWLDHVRGRPYAKPTVRLAEIKKRVIEGG